jgi:hypothetical protein
MKWIFVILFSLFCLHLNLVAQKVENLLLNPSFEEYADYFPEHWKVVSKSPDIIKKGVAFFPRINTQLLEDSILFMEGSDGNSYVNIVSSEILQGELKTPLTKGTTYQLEFYINRLPIKSQKNFTPITIKFSQKEAPIGLNSNLVTKYLSIHNIDTIKLNKHIWEKVSIAFVADGKERFMQIGNFGYALSSYGLDKHLVHFCFDNFMLYEKREYALYYDRNKFDPPKKYLESLKNFLDRNSPIKKLSVRSYASTIGSEKYNLELSEKRSVFLKNFIHKYDANIEVLTEYHGESISIKDDSSYQKSIIQILPELNKTESTYNKLVGDKIRNLGILDQKYRIIMDSIYSADEMDALLLKSLESLMTIQDSINQIELKEIINDLGDYPGLSTVGHQLMDDAFFIIQHAQLDYRLKYEKELHKAAENCEINYSLLPLFIDRNLLDQGKKQLYGSQCYFDDSTKKFVPFPISNIEKVDDRRKQYMLPPLEVYLNSLE